MPSNEDLDRYVSIWTKAIETQMHFNEMSVKTRQLGLTFVAAALGVAVVLLAKGDDFILTFSTSDHKIQVHVAVLLLFAGSLAMFAVRGLDLNVYHKMLRGAVTFNEDFEENYMKQIFVLNKGMTQAVSHYSRFKDAAKKLGGDNKYIYEGKTEVTAENKIKAFYRNTIAFLLICAFALLCINNSHSNPSQFETKGTDVESGQQPAVKSSKPSATTEKQGKQPISPLTEEPKPAH